MIIFIILFFNFLLFLILILLIAIKIIIFRIQIIIFIILIIISNLSGQSFYSNNFFFKKVINNNNNNNNNNNCYYIFFHFSSLQGLPIQPRRSLNPRVVRTDLGGRICTQRVGLLGKCLRLQTLLHGSAHPRLASLQTSGLWGCTPARFEAAAKRAGLPPAPKAGQTPR